MRKGAIAAATWDRSTYTAPDGTRFPYRVWASEPSKPEAVILAIHGLSGAVSDWWPLGERLKHSGRIAVFAYELRGMGNDPVLSRRGDIERAEAWFDDFASYTRRLEETYPETPLFWYGESLGSVLTLHMALNAPAYGLRPPQGLILGSPIAQVDGKLSCFKTCLFNTFELLWPAKRLRLQDLAPEAAANAQVVSGTTHAAQMAKTPHAVESFTVRLLHAIGQTVRRNRHELHHLKTPLLVLYGGKDVFTPSQDVVEFLSLLPEDLSIEKHFYPEGFHLLLHDQTREHALDDVEAWLKKRLQERAL